jgi:hypothetical protein
MRDTDAPRVICHVEREARYKRASSRESLRFSIPEPVQFVYSSLTPPPPLSCGKYRYLRGSARVHKDNKGLKSSIPHNKGLSARVPGTKHRRKTRKAVARRDATADGSMVSHFWEICQCKLSISIRKLATDSAFSGTTNHYCALRMSRTAPLKPTEGLNGPPARITGCGDHEITAAVRS